VREEVPKQVEHRAHPSKGSIQTAIGSSRRAL
jgi:hypothetical protein